MLEINLVPRSCWYKTGVRDKLSPDEWIQIVDATARRANFQCEFCGFDGYLVCHPDFQKRIHLDNWATYLLTGFSLVCQNCCDAIHIGRAQKVSPERFREVKEHIKNVNKLDKDSEVEFMVFKAFSKYRSEALYRWEVDIWSYLQDLGFTPNLMVDTKTRG